MYKEPINAIYQLAKKRKTNLIREIRLNDVYLCFYIQSNNGDLLIRIFHPPFDRPDSLHLHPNGNISIVSTRLFNHIYPEGIKDQNNKFLKDFEETFNISFDGFLTETILGLM